MPKKKSPSLSLGQKKLHQLGITLPLIPITTSGSLPKHAELSELRYKVSKGVSSIVDLERREKLSTEGWLREQSNLGLDVMVDGEMNRGDMITYFAQKITGFERGGTVRIYGNRYYQRSIVKTKLAWKEPLVVSFWQPTQRTTQKPVKAVVTGPYTLMDSVYNEFYPSRAELCQDLTHIIRKEVCALVESGAKIIQIDEMALCAKPDEFSFIAQALRDITKNLNVYFILRNGYEDVSELWPKIERLPVDQFYFESCNSNYSILPILKKWPTKKDVALGFIDSHSHVIEDSSDIGKALKLALRVIPPQQLWAASDSGLKTRTPEQASAKLLALSKAVLKIRKNF